MCVSVMVIVLTGRVPRSVDVEVACDLVDACVPGDTVHVSGVVKAVNADVAAGRSSSQARNLFLLYIDAHSIATTKVSRAGGVDTKQFSEKELRMIRAVATHADPFALVVASLCPGIFGMDAVKAALALGLFGGSQPSDHGDAVVAVEKPASAAGDDSSADAAASHSAAPSSGGSLDRFRVGVRPDPHILVVGDPGLGKSQMLRAVAGLSPRGVYVCGNTASSSGLTVVCCVLDSMPDKRCTLTCDCSDHDSRPGHGRLWARGRRTCLVRSGNLLH